MKLFLHRLKFIRKPSFRALLWAPLLFFLGYFFFFPLVRILITSLDFSALMHSDLSLTFSVVGFTFFQAFLSTLLTLAIGLPAAFLFSRFTFWGRSFLRTLTAIPFILPTVVVAAGFNAWLGPRGWVNIFLMKSLGLDNPPLSFVGSLGAILLAHIFYNTTIVIRVVSNALSRLDPSLEQAARTLGADPLNLFRKLTLPLILPSLTSSALLVFLFDFASFGVILLLGGPHLATLEVEIYLQAVHFFNLPLAAWLSLIQLLCTLCISIISRSITTRSTVTLKPRVNPLTQPGTLRQRCFVGFIGISLFLFYAFPLVSLPLRSLTRLEADMGQRGEVQYGFTTSYYAELFKNRNDSLFYVPPFQALRNSLGYAAITAILSLILGFPAATAFSKPGRLKQILDPLIMLPLGTSAVTLGLGFIITFGRLLLSPLIVPIAHTIIALPFVIRTLQPALASIPEQLRQAAATLGASPWHVWLDVEWPIIRRATISALVFAFTISLGEFGATVLVYRPDFPTLPTAIYRFLSQPGGQNYGQAMAMATILMLVTGVGILFLERARLPGVGEL